MRLTFIPQLSSRGDENVSCGRFQAVHRHSRRLDRRAWDAQATAALSTIDAFIGECDEALETYQRALDLSLGARWPEALAQVDRLCRAGLAQ